MTETFLQEMEKPNHRRSFARILRFRERFQRLLDYWIAHRRIKLQQPIERFPRGKKAGTTDQATGTKL